MPQKLVFDPKATKSRLLVPVVKPALVTAAAGEKVSATTRADKSKARRTIRFADETSPGRNLESRSAAASRDAEGSCHGLIASMDMDVATPAQLVVRDVGRLKFRPIASPDADDALQTLPDGHQYPASSQSLTFSVKPTLSHSKELTAFFCSLLVQNNDSAVVRSLLILVVSMDFLFKWCQVVRAFLAADGPP